MLHDGFKNIIPVLDNKEEFNIYDDEMEMDTPCNLGIRIAAEEQPDSQFYTSRLGVRMEDIIDFYYNKIEDNPNFKVKLLHFFINSGISDTPYYWNELEKYVTLYCKFKKINPDLDTLDIGGGMPFKDSLVFDFDYEYMINEIVSRIKEICAEMIRWNLISLPNLANIRLPKPQVFYTKYSAVNSKTTANDG